MTDDEATAVLRRIAESIQACPPGALARIATAEPSENLHIQLQVVVVRDETPPVTLCLTISLAENAIQAATPPVPAEHYATPPDRRN